MKKRKIDESQIQSLEHSYHINSIAVRDMKVAKANSSSYNSTCSNGISLGTIKVSHEALGIVSSSEVGLLRLLQLHMAGEFKDQGGVRLIHQISTRQSRVTHFLLGGESIISVRTLLKMSEKNIEYCTFIQFFACTLWIHKVEPMENAAGFRIRVDDELRAEFIAACKKRDRTAAQVLREFMRRYVDSREDYPQFNLFNDSEANSEQS